MPSPAALRKKQRRELSYLWKDKSWVLIIHEGVEV
jgi:hypothetical protein